MQRGMTGLLVGCLVACSGDGMTDDPTPPDSTIGPVADACELGQLYAVTLDVPGDPGCGEWLSDVRGRVGRQGPGSFVVWDRRTADGLALIASALHTLGPDWFDGEGVEITESLAVPPDSGIVRLSLPAADGTLGLDGLSPLYSLYNPGVPAAETSAGMADILPRHDLFVGLTDQQRLGDGGEKPRPRVSGLVPIHDPTQATLASPTWASATPGDEAILVGYAATGPEAGTFSIGHVLDDTEAEAAIVELAAAGDEEGDISYDAETEFLVAAPAIVGMSGGGVFDQDGQWLGVMVRGSTTESAGPYTRVVRATYVVDRLEAALAALASSEQEEVTPFLSPELGE